MHSKIIDKYNIPTPRYTSYPPANFFHESFSAADFLREVERNNSKNISVYIHIPFCRHLCYYCGCNSQAICSKEKMEEYFVALKMEIEMVLSRLNNEREISQIHYGGGTPTVLSATKLRELNSFILSKFNTIKKPEIAIEVHPGYLDMDYWRALCDAGFSRVSIGVQDFNEEVLRGVNRRPSKVAIEDIFELLRARGIGVNLDFIYGLPRQSVESFRESMERAVALKPDRIVTFSYAHVPWVNERMRRLEELGLPSTELKKDLFESAQRVLKRAGYCTIGMDHFVREGDELLQAYENKLLHRNFQGYCTRRTTGQVYGFGVSAISQLDGAYAQNTKDIDKYISDINEQKIPIVKGYALSERERIVREFITMMMCNKAVMWSELAGVCGLSVERLQEVLDYSEEKVADFLEDNIIEINGGSGIFMTTFGEIFVRNVAARFDQLLNTENNQRYSKPI